MKTFTIIWSGQLMSQIGTAMTRFALLIWAYQQTGTATTVALLGFFAFIPKIAISPVAGVWVDRTDRRRVMLLADTGAGLTTVALLLLFLTGQLQIWQLYLAAGLAGAFEAFQTPAYLAATSALLPKEQYGRASGLRSLAEFGAQVLAPLLGGALLAWQGLASVMLVDTVTFGLAVVTLLIVRVPAIPAAGNSARTLTFGQQMRVGFSYIWQRSGLVGFVMIMTAINFFAAFTWFAILPAMILARSGNNELALAAVQGAMGLAGVAGGLVVSIWGGPKRKIHGFLVGIALSFLLGDIPLAIGRSLPVWLAAAAVGTFFIPFIGSSWEAIWQAKVNLELQGRVLAVRNMVTQALLPAGYLAGGVAADHWLEPAMAVDGWLAPTFGWLVGVGPGAGMALMFVGSAVCAIVMCGLAYLVPAVYQIENSLPDHTYVWGVKA